MPEESFQEKTEEATPKRRQEAREKGNVAKSSDLNSALVLLAATLVLYFTGPSIVRQFCDVFHLVLGNASQITWTPQTAYSYFVLSVHYVLSILGPTVLTVLVVGTVAGYIQVGPVFSAEPITPQWSRIDPLSGAKKLFSKRSLVELVKGLAKIGIVGYVVFHTLRGKLDEILPLLDRDVGSILGFIAQTTFDVFIRSALAFLVLSILDYAFQRWEYEKRLRMSRQEIREERKQMEGDPTVKSRIRSAQIELAQRRRMMQELPEADVVITNPTQLAIALKYDMEEMDAPIVVAKGQRLIAEEIKRIAIQHSIPIIEDKLLAQALFKSVEVGMQISEELYRAVAEILSYVYQLKGKRLA